MSKHQLNYYKLVKEVCTAGGLTQCKTDECVLVCFENNIISGPKSMLNEDLLCQGQFLRMENIPMEKRIYKLCKYSVAALIVALYVDNNACRYNCIELVKEFEAHLQMVESRCCEKARLNSSRNLLQRQIL